MQLLMCDFYYIYNAWQTNRPSPPPTTCLRLPITHFAQSLKMSDTSPIYAPQASPRLYHQSGAELEADPTLWHPALEYSQPLSMANQNYNWTIKSEDTGSLETFHQQSVRFPSVRLPVLSPVLFAPL
jgi:hypothetical protein